MYFGKCVGTIMLHFTMCPRMLWFKIFWYQSTCPNILSPKYGKASSKNSNICTANCIFRNTCINLIHISAMMFILRNTQTGTSAAFRNTFVFFLSHSTAAQCCYPADNWEHVWKVGVRWPRTKHGGKERQDVAYQKIEEKMWELLRY